jgi:hypothetical protein
MEVQENDWLPVYTDQKPGSPSALRLLSLPGFYPAVEPLVWGNTTPLIGLLLSDQSSEYQTGTLEAIELSGDASQVYFSWVYI